MAKDILLDESNDLNIIAGDLDVGFSDEQHVEHILLASKGQYKQAPFTGVNISAYNHSSLAPLVRQKLEQEISLQLEFDGASEIDVEYNKEGLLNIEAAYEQNNLHIG